MGSQGRSRGFGMASKERDFLTSCLSPALVRMSAATCVSHSHSGVYRKTRMGSFYRALDHILSFIRSNTQDHRQNTRQLVARKTMHIALFIYASLLSFAKLSQAKDCEKAGFIFAIDLNHKPGVKDCKETCSRAETWFRTGAEAYLDNSKRQITCQADSGVCIARRAVTNPAVSSIPQEDNPKGMKQCTCKMAIFFPRWVKDQKSQNQMDCSDLGQDGTAGPELISQWNLEHDEHWYHIDSFSEGDVDCGSDKNECNCMPKKYGGKEDSFDTCWGQAKSFDIKFPKETKS